MILCEIGGKMVTVKGLRKTWEKVISEYTSIPLFSILYTLPTQINLGIKPNCHKCVDLRVMIFIKDKIKNFHKPN
ncbi:hypothetical protein CUN59_00565 [Cuspidothrix issatschenkoi CHARLIE-1]|jgi:hypothetical protein|uniref:Uncharacterized protein n=1 Tax=Cuspidothrix issatschenkoi CHARLIE-1 TaxID=2052836 RepID=A0A2S6CZP7_9CYAN|nr:hypothetical protein CUN59_00565 [Cuspidothrix issatschenkoi CHARLIE-1]